MILEICIIAAVLKVGADLYNKIGDFSEPNTQVVPTEAEKQAYEEMIDRNLKLSGALTCTALGGVFYPPLMIASAGGLIYVCIPLFKRAIQSFKEQRVRIEILDSAAAIAAIGNGYILLSCLGSTIYFTSQKLRLQTEKKSSEAIVNLFAEHPAAVWIRKDDIEIEIPFEAMQVGDIVVVNAGELIPADGVVINGNALIDQHILTGESVYIEKKQGDSVFASTIVISGKIHVQVEKAGQETVSAKISTILKNTADFTASVESLGQKIADQSVIPTFAISLIGFPLVGTRGTVALLSSDFFDTMRMAAPLSMMNFLTIASKQGILIKDGRSLQILPTIDTVVFDKTGTLTLEQPSVSKIYTFNGLSEQEVLTLGAAAEYRQQHPIALAILAEANKLGLIIPQIEESAYKIGYGIAVKVGNDQIQVGSTRYIEEECVALPNEFAAIKTTVHERGNSLVCVLLNGQLVGCIEIEPTIRQEAREIIQALKQRNMSFYIISGDHEQPTKAIANALGIDNYFAEVLPQNKAELIEQLKQTGKKVCFIGDGINDSLALKKADLSISMSGASTVATDSAQIIMLDKTLRKVPELFAIGYHFEDNMKNAFLVISSAGVVGISGVLFARLGLAGMFSFRILSIVSGAGVAMLPAIKSKFKTPA